ncbi:MAG: spore coat protein CotJB [Clostridia bacterium]|nr:spore coat protein CotJB [Clostridia bacterium]
MTKTERPNKRRLLRDVRIASFAVIETALYLDTHPCDKEAMEALAAFCAQKEAAVAAYEAHFGPLTLCACPMSYGDSADAAPVRYAWATLPWPWELDDC